MIANNDFSVGRRGELLAELFLQDLNPLFLSRSTGPNFGIDFFVGLKNAKGGMNLIAVEVKATELNVPGKFKMARRTYELLANSNVPGILLVVNVKANRFYYSELAPINRDAGKMTIMVPVTEVRDSERSALRKQLSR